MGDKLAGLCFLILFVLLGTGCDESGDQERDTYNSGTIYISCDETFRPVMDAQIKVFHSQNPEARIIVQYKPEADCLRDLLVDSIRMVIATRKASQEEEQFISDSLKTMVASELVARDLIAVLLNKASVDSFYSMTEVKDLLTGKTKKNLIPVFDGTSATSTVRFMLDSVLAGEKLSSKVAAASNSLGVIDYVSKVPNAVGFIGYSWIGNEEDSAQLAHRRKLQIAYLESTDSAGAYVQPSQYFIYTQSYPMVRDLVYILKEGHQGLGSAFGRFLLDMQKGQLIFRRAYLMPVKWPNYIREVILSENINNQ
ncbi:MAG: PstS family phosphate ABC transporter substrate-binding protein [Flavisolibacter sp.]